MCFQCGFLQVRGTARHRRSAVSAHACARLMGDVQHGIFNDLSNEKWICLLYTLVMTNIAMV